VSSNTREYSTDLGLLALAAIWGINFSVVKIVLEEVGPLALNALRFPLAVAALAWFLHKSPGPALPHRRDALRIIALGLVGNVAYQLCFIYGLDWTRAGNASLLLSTTPVWTLLLSALAGHERPTFWVSAGVLGTLAGMVLVVLGSGDALSLGSDTLRGDLLMVVASILWSIYTVAGRDPVSRYGALRVTTWSLYVGTPVLVMMGLPSLGWGTITSIGAATWAGIAYAGVLSIGLAYLLWYRGVQKLGNNRTAVYSNLVPVAALVTAWLWLGEVPTPLQGAGAGVILAGLTLARLAQSPGPSSANPSPTPSSSRWRISGKS
jgi:drug/metabolite transporter (DMT)-like permease